MKKAIPKDWYAWHSMKLRTEDIKYTEAVFVIADPDRGILILEVKGDKKGDEHKQGDLRGLVIGEETVLKQDPILKKLIQNL